MEAVSAEKKNIRFCLEVDARNAMRGKRETNVTGGGEGGRGGRRGKGGIIYT